MNTPENRVPVPGSEREPLPGARLVGPADPDERILVTVRVRPRASTAGVTADLASRRPRERQYLSHEEFGRRHGADPDDLARIELFARDHQLQVVESSVPRRTVVLSGTVGAFSTAFGTELARYQHPGGVYRGRTGPVHVPSELAEVVTGVFGLDNRPQASPHYRRRLNEGEARPFNAADGSFTPPQVAKLYDFPNGVTGQGQTIGIIELDTPRDPNDPNSPSGAGYRASDLTAYFAQLGIATPTVTDVSVDGGQNSPGINLRADGEVTLDIQVAGAVAPGANIVVYFAPNTDQGFLDALTTAIHDDQNNPFISISWGSAEVNWSPQALQNMDQAIQAAAALGVTVCCASGDGGSADGVADGANHVDFPASSPSALGCGGTKLIGSGTTISSEVVWNDQYGATGGGFSSVFGVPAWQTSAIASLPTPPKGGRGVPDVAGDADPATGYQVILNGQMEPIGGTSAVAPLWAGLIALINQALGQRVGFINPAIYALPAGNSAFHDIVTGDNGAYSAGLGWDPCTGLGSPDGTQLMPYL